MAPGWGQFAGGLGCGPLRAGGEGVSHILLPRARAFPGGMNVGLVGSFHLLERGILGCQLRGSLVLRIPGETELHFLPPSPASRPPPFITRQPLPSRILMVPKSAVQLSHQGWDLWGLWTCRQVGWGGMTGTLGRETQSHWPRPATSARSAHLIQPEPVLHTASAPTSVPWKAYVSETESVVWPILSTCQFQVLGMKMSETSFSESLQSPWSTNQTADPNRTSWGMGR